MAYGVATTSTSPFSASASRNRRYVSWGDAPTKAPPMKCTSARGLAPAGGTSTHAPSNSLQPRSRDPVFAAAEAAASRDSSCWNGDAGDAEEEELARAAVEGAAPRRASREAGEGESAGAETELEASPRFANRRARAVVEVAPATTSRRRGATARGDGAAPDARVRHARDIVRDARGSVASVEATRCLCKKEKLKV